MKQDRCFLAFYQRKPEQRGNTGSRRGQPADMTIHQKHPSLLVATVLCTRLPPYKCPKTSLHCRSKKTTSVKELSVLHREPFCVVGFLPGLTSFPEIGIGVVACCTFQSPNLLFNLCCSQEGDRQATDLQTLAKGVAWEPNCSIGISVYRSSLSSRRSRDDRDARALEELLRAQTAAPRVLIARG